MTRADKLLLAGLLLISLFSATALYSRGSFFADRVESLQAVISTGGKVIRRINLPVNAPVSFGIQGKHGSATVTVKEGQIRMFEASCPGGICLKQGWIKDPGQAIVCVPGEILIRIEGAAVLDAVTR